MKLKRFKNMMERKDVKSNYVLEDGVYLGYNNYPDVEIYEYTNDEEDYDWTCDGESVKPPKYYMKLPKESEFKKLKK
jgi:hypothetical protein